MTGRLATGSGQRECQAIIATRLPLITFGLVFLLLLVPLNAAPGLGNTPHLPQASQRQLLEDAHTRHRTLAEPRQSSEQSGTVNATASKLIQLDQPVPKAHTDDVRSETPAASATALLQSAPPSSLIKETNSNKGNSTQSREKREDVKCSCGFIARWHWECEMQCPQVEKLKSLQNVDVILYGDSLLEAFIGRSSGKKVKRAEGAFEVWKKHQGHRVTMNMALAGFSAAGVVHRLDNGHALPQDNNTKVAVVCLGSNDVLKMIEMFPKMPLEEQASVVSAPIIQVCERLACHVAEVIVMGVLPRGRGHAEHVKDLSELAPLPNKFSNLTATLNKQLERYADSEQHMRFLDCTPSFVVNGTEGGIKINVDRVPDVLHPNAFGIDLFMTECLDPALDAALGV